MVSELIHYLFLNGKTFKNLPFFLAREQTFLLFRVLLPAEVAELVDALDSGSSIRKDVRVQISLSAPFFYLINLHTFSNKI